VGCFRNVVRQGGGSEELVGEAGMHLKEGEKGRYRGDTIMVIIARTWVCCKGRDSRLKG